MIRQTTVMKYTLPFILSLFSLQWLVAQEVEIKKTSVFINGVEELTRDKCNIAVENTTCVFTSTKSSLPVFSIHILRYAEVGKPQMDINFIDFDIVCRVTMTLKNLYMNLYKFKVIDETGKADKEKASAFARLFNEKKDKDQ